MFVQITIIGGDPRMGETLKELIAQQPGVEKVAVTRHTSGGSHDHTKPDDPEDGD